MNKMIDWKLSLKLASNRADLAKELLEILIAELPATREQINAAYARQDYALLHQHIHKLHGAACYCGVPQLKKIVTTIDDQLSKQQLSELPKCIKKLNTAINKILKDFNPAIFDNL